jgi:alkaline phosphatase
VVVGLCIGRHQCLAAEQAQAPASNVILLIGDGMGPEMIAIAKDYARVIEGRELSIERAMSMGSLALVHVPTHNTLVSDSAAAATTMATGTMTVNGRIAMSPGGEPVTTIVELARKGSRGTGLVTTTRITHATPACFAVHTQERDSEEEIADLMAVSGVDVLMGGGMCQWLPRDATATEFSCKIERENDTNPLRDAREAGYRIVTDRDALMASREELKLLGLFGPSHLPYAIDRRSDDASAVPSLVEMTEVALGILSKNEKGFLLMVEGGRIDHAAHANDVAAMLGDLLEFDEAVGAALAFAETHPHTTVLITADHATGAPCMSARYSDEVGDTIYPTEANLRAISRQDASFEHILLALSRNPSAEELKRLVSQHISVDLSDEDAALVFSGQPLSPFHVVKPKYRRFSYPALALGRVLGTRFGTSWGTTEHFSSPVLLIGIGPGADGIYGYMENADIFAIMKTAAGL